jgi:hypothetical protein
MKGSRWGRPPPPLGRLPYSLPLYKYLSSLCFYAPQPSQKTSPSSSSQLQEFYSSIGQEEESRSKKRKKEESESDFVKGKECSATII